MATSTLTVKILGDAKSALAALDTTSSKLAGFGKFAAGAAAGVAAVGVAAGVGLFKVGESFDTQFDKIRVGTGATGDALEGLQDSFKNVLKDVPTDFDSAGTAIADLNTRLGLTGPALEASAEQMINLSRITGTDVAGNVDRLTRVFGDWGVATEDQAATMDQLYRASQASGIGIDDLASSMVQFGAPLRNVGFSMEESASLLSLFNKTGVNTDTVMAGLRAGVGKLAKAGEDVPDTFRRVVDEIEALGPGSEATAKAIELFGQRAGPDLADAIAGGKFELDDMLAAITDGGDTINQAAADTEDFGEKWQRIKNRVLVGLEPLATRVFDGVGKAMDRLAPYVDTIVAGVTAMIGAFSSGEVTDSGFVGFLQQVGVTAGQLFAWLQENVPPIIAQLQEIISQLVDYVVEHWPQISATIGGILQQVGDIITAFVELVSAIWEKWGDEIIAVVTRVAGALGPIISGALTVIQGIIQTITAAIKGDWSGVWEGIQTIVSGAVEGIKAYVQLGFDALRAIAQTALDQLEQAISASWDAIVSGVSGLGGRITSAASGIFDGVKNAFRNAINWIIDKWNALSFDVPAVKVAGVTVPGTGISISTPNIARLATGGVAYGPSLALIGEYAGAAANPEIVVSQSKLAEIIAEALREGMAGQRGGVTVGTIVAADVAGAMRVLREESRVQWAGYAA